MNLRLETSFNTELELGGLPLVKALFSFAFTLHTYQISIKYHKLCLSLSPKKLGAKMHFHNTTPQTGRRVLLSRGPNQYKSSCL
jgi:hypothetical protein